MGIIDDLKAEENKLRGIKASRGEGNGYNMPNAGKALKRRIDDARNRKKKPQEDAT